jgi:hypothetical protein
MARLRWPVSRSDRQRVSSSRRGRPAYNAKSHRIRAQRSSGESPATSEVAVMAPALIVGLRGRPLDDSRLISSKASPVGSTPMRASTAGLPRSSSASP